MLPGPDGCHTRGVTVGLLHTTPAHTARFDALLGSVAPRRRAVHLVDEGLLRGARAGGPESVRAGVASAVADLGDRGAEVVLCTCSTLGALVESMVDEMEVPVLRVDRPAAERAAALGRTHDRPVGAVVSLGSTLEPTRALLASVADRPVEVVLAEGAWARLEAGDEAGHLRRVAAAARALVPRVAVVVLAQVSMTGAVELLEDVDVPVLTTPRLGVEAAVRLALAGHA